MTERAALALSPELRRWHEHVRACQASSQTMVAYAKAHGGRSASELKINELGPGWWLYMTICWGVGGWRGRRTLG
jgi:hypothetical protein